MNSAAKAAAYRDMVELLSTRHIKGALEDSQGGVCLVGAVNKVTATLSRAENTELQREICDEILRRSPLLARGIKRTLAATDTTRSEDGGILLVEAWNDTPWRRTRTAVRLLQDLAHCAEATAKDELIAELTATIEDLRLQQETLRAHVASLTEENARLTEEVSFWKATWTRRRSRVTAEDLTKANAELAELDASLSATLAELAGV